MKTESIKPQYVMKLETINKDTINDYFIYEDERRLIRQGKVKSILAQFSSKDTVSRHFDSPLVINQMDKKRVIDGNHRIEAIKQQLDRVPDFSITIWIMEYKGLNREEERVIYTKLNCGSAESSVDFLKWHFKTIPYGEEMLRKLPASIYGSDTSMKLKDLIGAHINAKKQRKFEGGYSAGGAKTVKDFLNIDSKDIAVVSAFCKDMEEVFQKYYKHSPYYRSTPLQVFYRIWYDNKEAMPRQDLIKSFKAMFLDKWGEFNELSGHGGRSASITFYNICIDRLNSYRKKIHFISDKEILALNESKEEIEA